MIEFNVRRTGNNEIGDIIRSFPGGLIFVVFGIHVAGSLGMGSASVMIKEN